MDFFTSWTFISFAGSAIFWLVVIILDLVALFALRRVLTDPTAKALWAGVIIFAPIAGAVSFFIAKPTERVE